MSLDRKPPLRFPTWVLLAALALAAAGARWVTRSPIVYNWDSVHYVLAQGRYDIRVHQPHPPGSFYYVLLARAAGRITGDPHAALLLVSSLAGGLLVLVLFLLARDLADERAGWLAAALGASAPLFWFYGSVGLNYGPAGTLSALVALACVRMCRSSTAGPDALLAGVAMGILGGFRPTDVVFLAPACLWSAGCYGRAARRGSVLEARRAHRFITGALVLGLLFTLGWLVPNAVSTGGLAGYVRSIRDQEHLLARSSVLLAGQPAWNEAVLTHRRSLESTLGTGWLLLPVALAAAASRWIRKTVGSGQWSVVSGQWSVGNPELGTINHQPSSRATPTHPHTHTSTQLTVLGVLIVAPAGLFYLLGHFNSPGYALTYAGFLAAAAAALVASPLFPSRADGPGRAPRGLAAVVGLLLLGNGALFHWGWPNALLRGVNAMGQRALSGAEIRDHARYYRELRSLLDRECRPGQARILTSWTSTDGLRVAQAALPAYEGDVAQVVAALSLVPPAAASLPFLRLVTPAQLRAEGRPLYAIVRTLEDPVYHASVLGTRCRPVPIGHGHVIWRYDPRDLPESPPAVAERQVPDKRDRSRKRPTRFQYATGPGVPGIAGGRQ